ncbi:hypothetical protein VIGAN_04105700, partial [Vigna angularis var. angularis]
PYHVFVHSIYPNFTYFQTLKHFPCLHQNFPQPYPTLQSSPTWLFLWLGFVFIFSYEVERRGGGVKVEASR